MDEVVVDLVLAPFHEIVEKGSTASNNATEANHQDMLRAAQSLVKEGERALKRIEPLCRKHAEVSTPNFINALKEDGKVYLRPYHLLGFRASGCIKLTTYHR